MRQEEYRSCIARGMSGKQFTKDERKLEFCILAKKCSNKAKTREEALTICSQPKPPKPVKLRQEKPEACEKSVMKLAHCMVENIDMNLASNINSVETAIINAMIECQCQGGQ